MKKYHGRRKSLGPTAAESPLRKKSIRKKLQPSSRKNPAAFGDHSKSVPPRNQLSSRKPKRCKQVKKCVSRGGVCQRKKCAGSYKVRRAKCKRGCWCCTAAGCSELKRCRKKKGKCTTEKCHEGEIELKKGCRGGGYKCRCCYQPEEGSGESDESCKNKYCPGVYDPVCGSDGKTHSSACHLDLAACHNPCIKLKSKGPCERKCGEKCSVSGIHVCGSDGTTYPNQCHLEEAACQNPCITTLHTGYCECSSSALCVDEGGKCQQAACGKGSKKVDGLCPYSGCHCCVPNESHECPMSSDCLKQNGTCQKTSCAEGHQAVYDLCAYSGCHCCVPEQPHSCSHSVLCVEQGGTCQQTACKEGHEEVDNLCTYSDCHCCVPEKDSDSRECSSSTKCTDQNGTCQKSKCGKGYKKVDKLCSYSGCHCCVPDQPHECSSSSECTKLHGTCQKSECEDSYEKKDGLCTYSGCHCCVPKQSHECSSSSKCTKLHGTCQKTECADGYEKKDDLCTYGGCHCCVPEQSPDPCSTTVCPEIYAPVCGSDGVTYSNLCKLDVAACKNPCITLRACGTCGRECGSECSSVGPVPPLPVCGSDGNTYPSICRLDEAACQDPCITRKHIGPCECLASTECTKAKGICQATPCQPGLEVADKLCSSQGCYCCLSLLTPGVPNPPPGAPPNLPFDPCASISCSAVVEPVCGSDGRTYSNLCHLDIAACRNPCITLRSCGPCGHECGQPCGSNSSGAVCGSDGKTYPSQCYLDAAACHNPCITKHHFGSCDCKESIECSSQKGTCQKAPCMAGYKRVDGVCPDAGCHCCVADKCASLVCTALYAPVCGSDGKTYNNLCQMDVAACSNPCITLRACGPCRHECGRQCEGLGGPVCGSDGQTYPSMCHLDEAACQNPCITKKHAGSCECPPSDKCSQQRGVCQKSPCEAGHKIAGDFCSGDDCLCCIPPSGPPSFPVGPPLGPPVGSPLPPDIGTCAAIFCSTEISPVCGSDGVTYTNACQLDVAMCRNPCISLRSCGPCGHECGMPCIDIGEPVCGSDDNTYVTQCHLDEAACHNPCITKTHSGPCE